MTDKLTPEQMENWRKALEAPDMTDEEVQAYRDLMQDSLDHIEQVLKDRDTYRDNAEECPHCGVSLQGEPIPLDSQELYGSTHFSRKIGIYDRDRDMTVAWQCPDCGHRWSRTEPVTPGKFRTS